MKKDHLNKTLVPVRKVNKKINKHTHKYLYFHRSDQKNFGWLKGSFGPFSFSCTSYSRILKDSTWKWMLRVFFYSLGSKKLVNILGSLDEVQFQHFQPFVWVQCSLSNRIVRKISLISYSIRILFSFSFWRIQLLLTLQTSLHSLTNVSPSKPAGLKGICWRRRNLEERKSKWKRPWLALRQALDRYQN